MGPLNAVAGRTVYLDANVVIYAVEDMPPHATKLKELFNRFDRGELHAVTSELTLAEVLVRPIRDQRPQARAAYERLLRQSAALTIAPVTRDVLTLAAELRAALPPLKLPDAIHVATSLLRGCTTVLTNDVRFETVPGLPVLLLSNLA